MARIHDLIRQIAATNPDLAEDVSREVDVLSDRRAFGLNFERHTPEEVELPGRKVRRGDLVHILPTRGQNPTEANSVLWMVSAIKDGVATIRSHREIRSDDSQIETHQEDLVGPLEDGLSRSREYMPASVLSVPIEDLVVVAEFQDPIYAGLVSTGKIERGGDSPFHTVINAENFHALEMLLFTHRGKIDCIYIDPPYNTGARDWKYNNRYVEKDDQYRHSKWLAMMERRLLLAKELLVLHDSVLIVTIDEKEYLRLGLLLEQIFPDARIQMISTVINPAGSSRREMFSRSDEYIYFVFIGDAAIQPGTSDMLNPTPPTTDVRWDSLQRRGETGRRENSPNLFYPLYFNSSGVLTKIGEPVARGESTAPEIDGLEAVLPFRPDGTAMRWSMSGEELKRRLEMGVIRYYKDARGKWVIRFLQDGTIAKIESGEVISNGKDAQGFPVWQHVSARSRTPMTTWKVSSHSASDYGTPMITAMLGRHFPFPKSLYAVEDTIRFFVKNKPESIVLDFFAGSGTTAHAVMRLNKQDGGNRQSILVTNNAVSADERQQFRAKGLRPGDGEWEKFGICEYITQPRVTAAITGKTPDGEPIVGDYKFTDEFPMSDGFYANAEFFKLTYEVPFAVETGRDFGRIAPLLWLHAGAKGPRIDEIPEDTGWAITETYGVLEELDETRSFLKAIDESETVTHAYIVTDDQNLFQSVARDLPNRVEPVQLYESYLDNFRIDVLRAVNR